MMEQFLQQTLQSILLDGNINVAGLFVDYIDSWATPFATHYTNGLVETNLLRWGFKVILDAKEITEIRYFISVNWETLSSQEKTSIRMLKESGSYFSKIVKVSVELFTLFSKCFSAKWICSN